MNSGRLDGLDGLRGIAALCVFLSHVFAEVPGNAYLAVDFFFMLSGYVMARSYEARLGEPGYGAARSFLIARFRRLYPTIFLASLLGLPWLFWQVGDAAWGLAVATLLLIPRDGPSGPYMLNPPAWSIAYELVANVVHALVLARLGTRQLVVLGFVLLALLVLATRGHGVAVGPIAGNRTLVVVRALLPYVIGIVLHRTWRDVPPLRVGPVATWGAMPLFFALGTLPGVAKSLVDYGFVLVLCPLLIAGGLRSGAGSRLAAAAGALSFPLYAVHGPVVLTLQALGVGQAWQVAIGLAAGAVALWLTRWLPRAVSARPEPRPT